MNRAIFKVFLNDGSVVLQDDDRPGELHSSAWIRLKEFLATNSNLKIDRIDVGFRNNVIKHVVPDNQPGYFFIKNLLSEWGGSSMDFYIFGWLDETGIVRTKKVKVPEMVVFNGESRRIEECPTLILNKIG